MQRFLISPPFGNWLHHLQRFTSVRGSFTWDRRPGLIYHTVKSFRPVEGGWINQIGLRNPGIRAIRSFSNKHIYSVVGLLDRDWENLLAYCPSGITVEVNLGCPNVHQYGIPIMVLRKFCQKFSVIAKLSPTQPVDEVAAMCIDAGVSALHCCNTIPTSRGGISGSQLFELNLPIVERLASRYPGRIIAGGGIYNQAAVDRYAEAGASHFSLSTIWLTPWKVKSLT